MSRTKTDSVFDLGEHVLAQGAYDMPAPKREGSSAGLGQPARPSLDRNLISRVKLAHGVMATMAFAAFFPLGAIAIRTIPGRPALFAHLGLQFLAYAFFTAALGMGVWISHILEPFGADFVRCPPVLMLLVSG